MAPKEGDGSRLLHRDRAPPIHHYFSMIPWVVPFINALGILHWAHYDILGSLLITVPATPCLVHLSHVIANKCFLSTRTEGAEEEWRS